MRDFISIIASVSIFFSVRYIMDTIKNVSKEMPDFLFEENDRLEKENKELKQKLRQLDCGDENA
ncbi:MAG: hypothetical protein ACI4J0_02400 [Huintestinicola sp.]|uniref:hypothetical protein n=1 Tax=Huintestinicola sp. TaxID=2981661 RepID=UPI003F0EDA3F